MRSSPFRKDLLKDKRAFVTGGTQGMGLAMALELARHGAEVTVASRKAENIAAAQREFAAQGLRAHTLALDVRDRAAVEAAAKQLFAGGPVDILVNNAAGNFAVPFVEMSENAWDAVVNIVLQGTANVCRSFGKRWAENPRQASVINMVAGYGWTGAPWVSHSGAAKTAVLSLTKSLAVEWGPWGVRVNAIAPGFIAETGGERILIADEDLKARVIAKIPLGRTGTRDEISDAVLFLASDASSFVTGSVLLVDGGQDANSWNVLSP